MPLKSNQIVLVQRIDGYTTLTIRILLIRTAAVEEPAFVKPHALWFARLFGLGSEHNGARNDHVWYTRIRLGRGPQGSSDGAPDL